MKYFYYQKKQHSCRFQMIVKFDFDFNLRLKNFYDFLSQEDAWKIIFESLACIPKLLFHPKWFDCFHAIFADPQLSHFLWFRLILSFIFHLKLAQECYFFIFQYFLFCSLNFGFPSFCRSYILIQFLINLFNFALLKFALAYNENHWMKNRFIVL